MAFSVDNHRVLHAFENFFAMFPLRSSERVIAFNSLTALVYAAVFFAEFLRNDQSCTNILSTVFM